LAGVAQGNDVEKEGENCFVFFTVSVGVVFGLAATVNDHPNKKTPRKLIGTQ